MAGEGYSASINAAKNAPNLSGGGGLSFGDWASLGSSALQGMSSFFGGSGEADKRKAKEMKRQTLANMLNEALARELDVYATTKSQQTEGTVRKMAALRDAANNFAKSLIG